MRGIVLVMCCYFGGMSTSRMSVLSLHVLCQGIVWLIPTPHPWHKVTLDTRGLGSLCYQQPLLMAEGLSWLWGEEKTELNIALL